MDIPRGIEGDYIETSNNLFFDVKGLFHPHDRKICFIRFYSHPEGDRMKDDRKFKKIYDLNERYSFLKDNYTRYVFFSKELDSELQGVKNKDIKKIYTPWEYFRNVSQKSNISRLEENSIKLCKLFISEGGISEDSIGITGSSMVGLSNDDSDIDLIIYGTKTCLEFQDKLSKILNEGVSCRKYNLKEFHSHYDWRVGGSNIQFDDFMTSEQRKLHQGMFNGFEFFIRYIKSPAHWKGSFYDYKYKNCGRIKLKAEIFDDTDSIFTPCSYKIKVIKILEAEIPSNELKVSDINEICSYRGRFCEQALKGERVFVEGKLEKANFQDKETTFRIMLNDQRKDKMLILDK